MRVFITGATGFVGTALTKELLDHGHQVLGLTRSDAGAKVLTALGAAVHRGDLEDPASLINGARQADACVHLAFNHDFSRYIQNCEDDRRAIEALGSVLSGKPLLVTSGTAIARGTPGKPSAEGDPPIPSTMSPRAISEEAANDVARANDVRISIVRLPQVHDTHKAGLVSPAIDAARAKGSFAYIGDGQSRWPAAHISDVAMLYRLALEKAEKKAVYHAVGEEGVTHRAIAETLAKRLKLPVVSIKPEEAADYFGWLAMFVSMDLPASSTITRRVLSWQPKGPTLLEDLARFEPAKMN